MRLSGPIRPVAALVAALTLLAGCGGGGGDTTATTAPPSPEAQVRATWDRAVAAALAGDGARFCAMATPAAQATIARRVGLTCADAIRLLQVRLRPADRAAIRAAAPQVTVTGDRAVVRYTTTPALAELGFTGRTRLRRTGTTWRLQGI